MSGSICPHTIDQIRALARIDEVVGEYISLRRAGADACVGLCPFHEEKTPSFYVRPEQGYFHCFGCSEGGDVFSFIQKIEHINFAQAVERLAAQCNIVVEYDGEHTSSHSASEWDTKQRLIAANKMLAQYYQQQLATPDAALARKFLQDRGFTHTDSTNFGCGFAPCGWDQATQYLVRQGFTIKELESAGISKKNTRGQWLDRFRRRLIWPIKSITGDVIGFGARKIFPDDDMAKYINTPETILYKKSSVLFGIDRAKKDISQRHQVVIVEGYTDVMAMHAAGITTAVAACGTAFGDGHITLIRRLLLDDNYWRGEMIYTFDGDQAGKNAALKAFEGDQKIISQSFVCIVPDGMDPCELRMKKGDQGLKELIARRIPMIEFVLKTHISSYDLSTPEGRIHASNAAAMTLGSLKDVALRKEYIRSCANWLGLDSPYELQRRINHIPPSSDSDTVPVHTHGSYHRRNIVWEKDPQLYVQKKTIQCVLQYPQLVGEKFDALPVDLYTDEVLKTIKIIISNVGLDFSTQQLKYEQWISNILATATGYENSIGDDGEIKDTHPNGPINADRKNFIDELIATIRSLMVEPLAVKSIDINRYVTSIMIRAQEQWVGNQISAMKLQLHHINPHDENYMLMFSDLVALESYRKTLVEQISAQ